MSRAFEVVWWLLAALMVASLATDMIWLDGKVDAWVALCWVAIALMNRWLWITRGRS